MNTKPTPTIPPVETLREAIRIEKLKDSTIVGAKRWAGASSNFGLEDDITVDEIKDQAAQCLLHLLETIGPEKLQWLMDGECVVVPKPEQDKEC